MRAFRYSPFDCLPVLSGVGILALMVVTFVWFGSLPVWFLIGAFLAVTLSYSWNLQCISHNFVHNPYFSNPWLNRAFSVVETLTIGVPQVLYHHYHMNHHFGDNDAMGADGTTRDWSSTFRYGKDGKPEAFWKYCLLSFFRVEAMPVVRKAMAHGREHMIQLVVECVVLGAFWLTMLLCDWRYLVLFYLPSYYVGWVISYAEGYLEHYDCQPGNHFANSVSSYNKLYNFLWFNNGYHQEHHWDPKVHWTRMPQLHEEIRPQLLANHTKTVAGPHLTTFLEEWWKGKNGSDSTPASKAA